MTRKAHDVGITNTTKCCSVNQTKSTQDASNATSHPTRPPTQFQIQNSNNTYEHERLPLRSHLAELKEVLQVSPAVDPTLKLSTGQSTEPVSFGSESKLRYHHWKDFCPVSSTSSVGYVNGMSRRTARPQTAITTKLQCSPVLKLLMSNKKKVMGNH